MSWVLSRLAELAVEMAPSSADRRAACAAIFDLMTAAVAAPRQAFAPALREAYGDGPCSLWLTGERASPSAAAFHNALVSARLDLDDGHRKARGHPGAAVIPAVLAETDRIEASGRKINDAAILRAIVVGYEIGLRIAAARGFYARTGFWAGFAAAAGAGVLLGLPPARLAHALAIAGETGPHMATNTAGPAWPQPNGSDVKEGIPWGVVHGLAAVLLSESGMTGPLDLVDHAPFHFEAQQIVQCIAALIERLGTFGAFRLRTQKLGDRRHVRMRGRGGSVLDLRCEELPPGFPPR